MDEWKQWEFEYILFSFEEFELFIYNHDPRQQIFA